MRKVTKIDTIRAELNRIASANDRMDPIAPTMKACWHFTRMMVIGKIQTQAIDFDCLKAILKKIPTAAGESHFWQVVNSTTFEKLMEELNRECAVIPLREHLHPEKAQA